MRKIALFAAVGLTSVAVGSAVAADVEQGIQIKVTPNTKPKPGAAAKRIKLFVETTTKKNNKDEKLATSMAVIHFDKNVVFANSKYPSCSIDQVKQDETACKKGSKVGSGSATGEALGMTENLKVTAFDGPGTNKFFLHVVGRQNIDGPLEIDAVLDASLKSDTGKFGKKLVVPIPKNLQQPLTGVFATLTRFTTTVDAASGGQPYVALKGCPKTKKLSFKGDFTFTDGDKKNATDTVACR
jgi:hypothetical protein